MDLTATFFSHFGAIKYKKSLHALGIDANISPVPRALSSSCGVCVKYCSNTIYPLGKLEEISEDIESIAQNINGTYKILYTAKGN